MGNKQIVSLNEEIMGMRSLMERMTIVDNGRGSISLLNENSHSNLLVETRIKNDIYDTIFAILDTMAIISTATGVGTGIGVGINRLKESVRAGLKGGELIKLIGKEIPQFLIQIAKNLKVKSLRDILNKLAQIFNLINDIAVGVMAVQGNGNNEGGASYNKATQYSLIQDFYEHLPAEGDVKNTGYHVSLPFYVDSRYKKDNIENNVQEKYHLMTFCDIIFSPAVVYDKREGNGFDSILFRYLEQISDLVTDKISEKQKTDKFSTVIESLETSLNEVNMMWKGLSQAESAAEKIMGGVMNALGSLIKCVSVIIRLLITGGSTKGILKLCSEYAEEEYYLTPYGVNAIRQYLGDNYVEQYIQKIGSTYGVLTFSNIKNKDKQLLYNICIDNVRIFLSCVGINRELTNSDAENWLALSSLFPKNDTLIKKIIGERPVDVLSYKIITNSPRGYWPNSWPLIISSCILQTIVRINSNGIEKNNELCEALFVKDCKYTKLEDFFDTQNGTGYRYKVDLGELLETIGKKLLNTGNSSVKVDWPRWRSKVWECLWKTFPNYCQLANSMKDVQDGGEINASTCTADWVASLDLPTTSDGIWDRIAEKFNLDI